MKRTPKVEQQRVRSLQKFNNKKTYNIPKKFLVRGIPSTHVVCSQISNHA